MVNKPFRHGLVVGKFSPLHLGHEWLLQQAEKLCDELVILSWSNPEFKGCEAARRRRWLHQRFPNLTALVLDSHELISQANTLGKQIPRLPHNNAPDIESRLFVAWVCENLLQYVPDAVFTSESYGDGFARELSRYFYKDETSIAHHCIDITRSHVPISGTALRADLHGNRLFLAPEIYSDFITRVVLLGGESTGKTTLAKALAEALDTQWAAEYGRELWLKKNGKLEQADMLEIAQRQIARENQLARISNRFLFCDSSPLTTYFYSMALFGEANSELEHLTYREYDIVLLCADDFPFVQDGTRQDKKFRSAQQRWYESQLVERNTPYTILSGNVENRVQQALELLSNISLPDRAE